MKNAVLFLIFICLLVPNALCTKAFSQAKPAEEGSQQPTGDSVGTETTDQAASAGEGELEQQPEDDSADAQAASVEKPEGDPTEAPKPEPAEIVAVPTESVIPAPLESADQTTIPQPTDNQTDPLVLPPSSPKPSSGTGLIISGSVVLGIGVLNLLAIPLCYVLIDTDDEAEDYVYSIYEDDYELESAVDDTKDTARDVCVIGSLVFGGVHVAVGLPLLIVGLNQRSDYNEWREKNPAWAGFDFRIGKHNAIASWKTDF